ncbi:MAG: electron transfer flavoprotein subunit beta/FixA family protein [Nitrospirota bacterium]
MNIIVCIKQVPDTAEVKINPETNTLIREGVPSIINPYDMYAIEEGLRLKERYGGRVTVLTMGPPQAKEAIKEAISMGVDEGILISDKAFAGADTLATSYTLSAGIKKIGAFDFIICGKQAIDGDTAQVGPELAEHLDIPHIAYVKKIHEIRDGTIRAYRMMDDGYDVVESSIPVLITVVKEINEPRMPSLKGKIRAKNYEPVVWNADAIGADRSQTGFEGSPTHVVRIFGPKSRSGRRILEGAIEKQVEELVGELKKAGVLV